MVFQHLCLFPGLSRPGNLNILTSGLSRVCTNPANYTACQQRHTRVYNLPMVVTWQRTSPTQFHHVNSNYTTTKLWWLTCLLCSGVLRTTGTEVYRWRRGRWWRRGSRDRWTRSVERRHDCQAALFHTRPDAANIICIFWTCALNKMFYVKA